MMREGLLIAVMVIIRLKDGNEGEHICMHPSQEEPPDIIMDTASAGCTATSWNSPHLDDGRLGAAPLSTQDTVNSRLVPAGSSTAPRVALCLAARKRTLQAKLLPEMMWWQSVLASSWYCCEDSAPIMHMRTHNACGLALD